VLANVVNDPPLSPTLVTRVPTVEIITSLGNVILSWELARMLDTGLKVIVYRFAVYTN
jgi:hypothetical protein